MKVNGVVITSSPGSTPAASSARCSALVPLLTPVANCAPQYGANSASNAATWLPRTYWVLSSNASTALSISSLIERYCARRSTKGTGSFTGRSLQLDRQSVGLHGAGRGLQHLDHAQTGPAVRQ